MKRDIDKFFLMKVFHAVATKGSFTKGAQAMGMTVSSVSKSVQQLENSLKAKLMYRTTRSQSLTDAGKNYLERARRILADVNTLEQQLLEDGDEPSGTLRVTAPNSIGQFLLGPKISDFIGKYPRVKIDLILNDRVADITEEGFDIAIRSLKVPDMSPFYSKKLGAHGRKLVASPQFLKRMGVPDRPEQLIELSLLNYTGIQALASWSFSKGSTVVAIEPQATYTCNNYYALYQAALGGVGIANLYHYLVDDDLAKGNLVQLLPEWKQKERDLYAIYQQSRKSSPKLDKFLDFLSELV